MPPQLRKVVRFVVVGATVALVFMGLNWLFGHWMGKGAAYLLAYPPALMLHYLLNKHWTFGSASPGSVRQVSEYLVMVLVTFAIQSAVFKWLTSATTLPGWVDAGAANGAQMVITFLAMQFRVFRQVPKPK
jgi:putative flippase GtrA